MKRAALLILAIAATFAANAAQTEAEIRAQYREAVRAARAAYTNALAEIGITNATPKRTARQTAGKGKTALTKSQAAFFENRRIAVKRDTETLPGYVITTWYRNGKPDTKAPAVVTNALHKIIGAEQLNPIQELAERMRQSAEQWQAAAETWQAAATNNAARVERVTAALDDRRAEYVEKRDAAVLPSTKAIYQAFIDAIDRIKEKLNAEGN